MVGWMVAAAVLAGAPAWKQVQSGDVQVFTRSVPGQRTAELKALAYVEGSPAEVRDVLEDEAFTQKSSAHLVEYRTVQRLAPNSVVRYGRVSFPFFEDRDYFIQVTLEKDLAPDGSGSYRSSWRPWGLDRPSRASVVRITENRGYWQVDPVDHGTRSRVEYYLSCDPGGSLPAWAIDLVQTRVVPDVLRSLQREVVHRRTAGASAAAH